ncbi:Fc receptor-like A [Cyprinus carpio]|uniref:Fc receptor-like A n=1 Tax=Cyprinus carpio TaxID=7962 RepID=A0A9R0B2G4_CYPCA|nr:Fc receptor-like A [Cyprinus carpio]
MSPAGYIEARMLCIYSLISLLMVPELRVEIPAEIIEGESPVLFCKTTCDLSGKTNFTWYKNGKRLSERIVSEQLLLPSVSSDDTGNYSCAVRDQKHLSSPAVTLSVRCTSRLDLHIS